MADTSSIHIVVTNGLKIPMYTGKQAELKPWMTALLKKERIYKLTDSELVTLAYDFTEGIASAWIGENYDHPDVSSAELFQLLNAQFGEIINSLDAARTLIRIKQKQGEILAILTNRMRKLARIAYQDAEHTEGHAIQVQLAEFFYGGLKQFCYKRRCSEGKP